MRLTLFLRSILGILHQLSPETLPEPDHQANPGEGSTKGSDSAALIGELAVTIRRSTAPEGTLRRGYWLQQGNFLID